MDTTNIKPGDQIEAYGSTYTAASRDEYDAQDYDGAYNDDLADGYIPVKNEDGYFTVVAASGITKIAPAARAVTLESDSRSEWNRALLELAADHDRKVSFAYDKGSGTVERRELLPSAVSTTKRNAVIVTGHDPVRDDVRAYRLDRIQGYVNA